MSDKSPLPVLSPKPSARPHLSLLVLMIAVLFLAMIAAGVVLTNQISVVVSNAGGADWTESFVSMNRALLFILGIAALLLLIFFSLFIVNLRRYTDGRSFEQQIASSQQTELANRVQQLATDLQAQRDQFKAVLSVVQDGVVYAEGGNIRYANRALANLLGYPPEEFGEFSNGGNGFASQFQPMYQIIQSGTRSGGVWQGPYKLLHKDGSELDVSIVGKSIDGTRDHTITIIKDSSQEKRLQREKTRFISNTSHELRTPLANLKTRLYLLRKQPDKSEEHLLVLESTTEYMGQLIEDMMDHARFEKGVFQLEREEAIFQDIIQESVNTYQPKAERREVRLVYHQGDERDTVFVDHRRILQVANNLIANALNHTAKGGLIEIKILHRQPGQVGVEVRDNGPAISPDKLAHIFQPFEDASLGMVASGTVMGLTLAKEIVELHGGQINVASDDGRGTVIRFTIPCLTESMMSKPSAVSTTS
ncbi:MAG: PAS domain-containing sensor histidine kinase [Anaerolineae bacterium]|nr:PAS domain-containing sensor histidine kinase [Anaerolineae bacterium]